jgi:hypothetical protein
LLLIFTLFMIFIAYRGFILVYLIHSDSISENLQVL